VVLPAIYYVCCTYLGLRVSRTIIHEIPTCQGGIYTLCRQRADCGYGPYPSGHERFSCVYRTRSAIGVEAAFADYQQKVYAAAGGGHTYSVAKRESKKRLADLLQRLAFYVSTVSDGNLAKLYSSGFPVTAKKRKGQSPDIPEQPFIRDGRKSGEVAYGFKPVGRDMFYDYCFATAVDKRGNPIWGEVQTTTRSFTAYADGFERGGCVYFRVRARNKHGISRWTQPIRWMVQ